MSSSKYRLIGPDTMSTWREKNIYYISQISKYKRYPITKVIIFRKNLRILYPNILYPNYILILYSLPFNNSAKSFNVPSFNPIIARGSFFPISLIIVSETITQDTV